MSPIKERRRCIPLSVWRRLQERFDYRCAYCGRHDDPLHCDHMIPSSRGGDDSLSNLVPACQVCNLYKGIRTPLEFFFSLHVRVKFVVQAWGVG